MMHIALKPRWLTLVRRSRHSGTLVAVVLATLVLSLVSASSARADCGDSNSGLSLVGSTSHLVGYTSWNVSSRHFQLETDTDTGFSTDYCADAWFDWTFQESFPRTGWQQHHYDGRVARDCQPASLRWADGSDGYTEPNPGSNYRYLGPHKLGSCRSNGQDSQNEIIDCGPMYCATIAINNNSVAYDLPNTKVSGWVRNQAGDNAFHSGGDPLDPSS